MASEANRANRQVKDLAPELASAAGSAQTPQYGAVLSEELRPPSADIAAVQKDLDELPNKIKMLQKARGALSRCYSAGEMREARQRIADLRGEIELSMSRAREELNAARRSEDYSTQAVCGAVSRRLALAEQAYTQELASFCSEHRPVREIRDDAPAPRVESHEKTRMREQTEENQQRHEDGAAIIHEQTPMLDKIEANITGAGTRAGGAVEMRQAHRHQSSVRKAKLCACLLLLLVVAALVPLLVALARTRRL